MIAGLAYAAVLCAAVVCLCWLGHEVRRIVSEYKRRSRMRTFARPDEVTLLDVILREVDICRSKRSLDRGLSSRGDSSTDPGTTP